MTDSIINTQNADTTSIDTTVVPSSTDSKIQILAQEDTTNTSLQQAATALVGYVQTVMPSQSGDTLLSDNADALHGLATQFIQQTANAISTGIAPNIVNPQPSNEIQNSTSSSLTQATSSFVEHLGDLLINPQASDTASSSVLMQDVQEIWKNKSTTDTVASTAVSLWESVKSSQHLPVIAGMLASVFFKKK